MKNIIKEVLDGNGVQDRQEEICNELVQKLTEGGYVHIDNVKLNPDSVILCVSKIMNLLQETPGIIIKE